MKWNAKLYQDNHDYVAEYGKSLLDYVPDDKTQIILDLGCGTGTLTCMLVQKANVIIEIDGSKSMVRKAKEINPQIEFYVMDACELVWQEYFTLFFPTLYFIGFQTNKVYWKAFIVH